MTRSTRVGKMARAAREMIGRSDIATAKKSPQDMGATSNNLRFDLASTDNRRPEFFGPPF